MESLKTSLVQFSFLFSTFIANSHSFDVLGSGFGARLKKGWDLHGQQKQSKTTPFKKFIDPQKRKSRYLAGPVKPTLNTLYIQLK